MRQVVLRNILLPKVDLGLQARLDALCHQIHSTVHMPRPRLAADHALGRDRVPPEHHPVADAHQPPAEQYQTVKLDPMYVVLEKLIWGGARSISALNLRLQPVLPGRLTRLIQQLL